VVYVINDLSIGGAEMMLYKLLAATDRQRFEPVVVSLIDRGALRQRIEKLGIVVHTTRMKPGWPSPLAFCRLVTLLHRLKPDLVLGWMYHSCLAAQLANFFLPKRTRVLWSIHYSITSLASEKKLTAAVIRVCARLSRYATRVIFVSRASQIQHRPLGYQLNKSCVIPNGINVTEFFPSTAARASVRQELGLPADTLLIGMMGRYHLMKDHDNFLAAAARLAKTQPKVHFLLVGRGVDQENRALRLTLRKLNLEDRVQLLGERHDMPRLTAALDVFTLASAYGESFPNVIGEAMAAEVCCVATDVGDARWMVSDTGRLIPPRDSRALATAWQELIEIGSAGRAALGRSARARVIAGFTLESVVAHYEDLFEDALANEAAEKLPTTPHGVAGIASLDAGR
jgi:glycosyltransferase involved in cell wall biosynthesis